MLFLAQKRRSRLPFYPKNGGVLKNRVGTSFEPENRCFRRFWGQKSNSYLFRIAKSMFSTILGSKIEFVPLSNRKIDVFDDFGVKNHQPCEMVKFLLFIDSLWLSELQKKSPYNPEVKCLANFNK